MRAIGLSCLLMLAVGCSATPQQLMQRQLLQAEQQLIAQAQNPQQVAAQLMEDAEQLSSNGNLLGAVMYLERARHYQAESPELWFQLARYNSMREDYRQAESCALRTIRFSSDNIQLQVKGWRLIEQARVLSGDEKNAHYAATRANELEKQLIVSHN